MSNKSCAEFILGHAGTAFLKEDDAEYGNPVSFDRVVACDELGVFLDINEFAAGVFYPWSSVKKLHLPQPMPTERM